MQRITYALTVLTLGSGMAFAADLPTPSQTPGDMLKQVPSAKAAQCISQKTGGDVSKGDDITPEMICTLGYTQCVRNVSAAMKAAAYHGYGLEQNHTGYCTGSEGCEVDHLISLEIGGANTVENLWPQSYDTSPWNAHVNLELNTFDHFGRAGF
jgi:hypothetical protein